MRGAERIFQQSQSLGSLGDLPLMVVSRGGKRIDLILSHESPITGRDLVTDQSFELRQADSFHAAELWKPRASLASLSSNGAGCQ